MDKKVAIIDLGSNSVRMIVVAVNDRGAYRLIDQVTSMVRLGRGMGNEKVIQEESLSRSLSTLKIFKKFVDSYNVDMTIAVATAALRRAANQKEVLKRIKKETGLRFQVLSTDREAYYSYLGVINTLYLEDFIMVDIGGGSIQIAKVLNRKVQQAVNFPFGSITLMENFGLSDEISDTSREKALSFIKESLDKIPWLNKEDQLPIVGLGGSLRNLGRLAQHRFNLEYATIHNLLLSPERAMEIVEDLAGKNYRKRLDTPGVDQDRGDIILGGLLPFQGLIEKLEPTEILLSGSGLREGLFFEKFLQEINPQPMPIKNILDHSLYNTLGRYQMNVTHAEKIHYISLKLFRALQRVHNLSSEYESILRAASLLHDLGMNVDYYNHHNHSFYLIIHSRIYGLTQREIILSAFIAGEHRGADLSQVQEPYYKILTQKEKKIIEIMGMFLKIAEMLDRNQYGQLTKISTFLEEEDFTVTLLSSEAIGIEDFSIEPFKEEFYDLFGKRLIINTDHY
ncbi:Ppx/GppA phosphatase family protein [Isachenkonia alkalipeptolytica]|uniref:Ppx/GppA family phosphatase n=1 Tax=Isachenkonia alkalipeptolytica TaxID=2565777 RepID=A0AA44BGC2_9CLOT|nr:Ppx/GppA phosphatase family protein [Isachenkonia alkalipeptolytica]NBG89246.1 Ppx/GppA family phosphatase [Isachenkonia alkalipeptolytica]